jgi:hypothetical protein
MVTHMKTTVEIPDALLDEARAVAEREGLTVRVLLEEGLRRALADRRKRPRFTLRRASVGGRGLAPALEGAPWETLRDLAYGGDER